MWKYLKQLVKPIEYPNLKRIMFENSNGKLFSDNPIEIAHNFNEYFVNSVIEIENSI